MDNICCKTETAIIYKQIYSLICPSIHPSIYPVSLEGTWKSLSFSRIWYKYKQSKKKAAKNSWIFSKRYVKKVWPYIWFRYIVQSTNNFFDFEGGGNLMDFKKFRMSKEEKIKYAGMCKHPYFSRNIDENQSPDILLRRRKSRKRESNYLNTQSWTKILGPVDFVYTLADAPYHVRAL